MARVYTTASLIERELPDGFRDAVVFTALGASEDDIENDIIVPATAITDRLFSRASPFATYWNTDPYIIEIDYGDKLPADIPEGVEFQGSYDGTPTAVEKLETDEGDGLASGAEFQPDLSGFDIPDRFLIGTPPLVARTCTLVALWLIKTRASQNPVDMEASGYFEQAKELAKGLPHPFFKVSKGNATLHLREQFWRAHLEQALLRTSTVARSIR